MTTTPRTAAATVAAAKSARERKVIRAAELLRENGWTVNPPGDLLPVKFNEWGQCLNGEREATYRCPVDGKESWYVASADRFFHRDGTENRRCLRAMHLGQTRWPTPRIIR